MANISNVEGNPSVIKKSYKKFLALGERLTGSEYKMTIEGYSDLTYLVASTQLPAMQREVVELRGPQGIDFSQQGRFINKQDVSITFMEVLTGRMFEQLREWVKKKSYLKVTIGLVSESQTESSKHATVVLEDCWIEIDATDLSDEDSTTAVKPSGTLHANWVSWLDDAGQTISLG